MSLAMINPGADDGSPVVMLSTMQEVLFNIRLATFHLCSRHSNIHLSGALYYSLQGFLTSSKC